VMTLSKRGWIVATAMISGLLGPPSVQADVTSLAPFAIVLDGRVELVGIAVTDQSTRYVTDRGAGTVYRINAAGGVTSVATGLDKPAGVALDATGRLLIAEEHAGQILRLESNGTLTVLATGIKTPRWIAVNGDGSLYVGAHRLTSPDGTDTSENRTIVRLAPDGSMSEVATGIVQLQGLVRINGSLIAASKGLTSGSGSAGALLRYPVNADGTLGTPATWVGTGLKQPVGLALDALNSVYVSSKELAVDTDISKRAIGKVHPDVRLTDFAASLSDPQGLALGPDGALYLADGKSGRLYRFQAPAAPALDTLPDFTNQPTVSVAGTTDNGAQVDVFLNEVTTATSGLANSTGRFAIAVTLTQNAPNTLHVFATGSAGDGLTSVSASAETAHDSVAPSVTFLAPPEGYVRGTVIVSVRATDAISGVATMALSAAGQSLSPTVVPPLPALGATGTATWDTTTTSDGTQSLRASATDRAGNLSTPVTHSVTVDNTPPDTQITTGPTGTINTSSATFTFAATDNLTPAAQLVFAWRVDAGAWSPFSLATTAAFSGLSDGAHTFDVKARDLAGNEDVSPATRQFSVTTATLRVTISSPGDGATINSVSTVVSGVVEGASGPIGVVVNNVRAAVSGATFTVLVPITAPVTTVRAVATSGSATASAEITITLSATADVLTLRANPPIGAAPLSVTFSLVDAPPAALIELDVDGDGQIDFSGPSLDGQVFTLPVGVYLPTVSLLDMQGVRHSATMVLQVIDPVSLDSQLQQVWSNLRSALSRNDVSAAVQLFATTSRDAYTDQLSALATVGALPQVANDLQGLALTQILDGAAEYEIRSVRGGTAYSFEVLFVVDVDGVWRIAAF
jgi:sugar lactone lactonase YvrE